MSIDLLLSRHFGEAGGGSYPIPSQETLWCCGIAGRKTGKIRYTPVSYARIGPNIYCYQGKETKGQWYLNLLANPEVEVLLPGGRFSGHGEEVSDTAEKIQAIRQILLGSGLNRSMYGFDPEAAADEVVREKTRDIPVVRIRLDSMNSGP